MAQTTVIAPTTAAATSTDITVTATTPARVAAYTTDTGGLTKDFQAFVQVKTPAGYQPYFDDYRKQVILSLERTNVNLIGPGIYNVVKGGTAHVLGVCSDQ